MDQGQNNHDIDEHFNWQNQQFDYDLLFCNIYDTLCVIECDIMNKVKDIGFVNDGIKKAISLIRQSIYCMPTWILIKVIQVSQLILQYNDPIIDDCIKEFQQLVKNEEKVDKQLFLIKNTENYEISKAFIYDYQDIYYVSLCPNEKYLLVGTSRSVYLYDILTKLNKNIHKGKTENGVFSQNSKYIVLQTKRLILIIDIKTNKKQYFNKYYIYNISCFGIKNYLHLICKNIKSQRIIKIDLNSKRQIFTLNIPIIKGEKNQYITFLEDLIILQSYFNYLQFFNEKTRKFTLTIKLQDQGCNQLFLINNNEMLSKDDDSKLIIWNIDYENKCLIKNRILPFYANKLYRGNPNFGCFYLIYNNKLQIIDESYKSIFQGDSLVIFNGQIEYSIQQLNSHRIFIIFQEDGIYILKRHMQG